LNLELEVSSVTVHDSLGLDVRLQCHRVACNLGDLFIRREKPNWLSHERVLQLGIIKEPVREVARAGETHEEQNEPWGGIENWVALEECRHL
jgi:hypothetical protein